MRFAYCLTAVRAPLVWALAGMLAMPSLDAAPPESGTATWTLYYVFEATGSEHPEGNVKIKTLEGDSIRVRVTPSELKRANIEGTAGGIDEKTGEYIISNFVKLGHWEDLPPGWEGRGNRVNPLATYRSVAADQRQYRYGSRLFVEDLVGFTPPGFDEPHDGYLWIADVGGGIKGSMRFDLFVGKQSTYDFVMKLENEQGRWKVPTEIEPLPSAPAGWSPKSRDGVKKILGALGLLEGETPGINQIEDALESFQRQHPHIPKPEYRSSKGAVTLWYLTQAAMALSKELTYNPIEASTRSQPEKTEQQEEPATE